MASRWRLGARLSSGYKDAWATANSPPISARPPTDYARHRAGYPDWLFERLMRRGLARPGMRALDLATGTGYLARGLAQRGLTVTGHRYRAGDDGSGQGAGCGAGPRTSTMSSARRKRPACRQRSFDLVTAACCWHWFDRSKASAEVLRLLKPGGWLVICAQNWFPLGDNVVARTEAIVQRHNPKWPFGGLDGMTARRGARSARGRLPIDRELLGRFRDSLQPRRLARPHARLRRHLRQPRAGPGAKRSMKSWPPCWRGTSRSSRCR